MREAGRRHELGDQPIGGDGRAALGEGGRAAALGDRHMINFIERGL
jgi:hypothetical protein